jgi:pyruvate formate lyase activating enzyme
MEIKGFIENSLLEWEGKIASVVFLPFCNLRCRYCHAAHLICRPSRLESIPREQVLGYLARQEGWLDGAVITGGEPTLHGGELVELIEQIRDLSLAVMLETNGTDPRMVERLIADGLLDAIAMDVKAPLTTMDYERVAGEPVDPTTLRATIETIKSGGIEHEFRVTLVPELVGADELRRLRPELEGAQKVALQNFQPDHCLDPDLRGVVPYDADRLDEFERIISPAVERCVVRGRDHAALARSQAS